MVRWVRGGEGYEEAWWSVGRGDAGFGQRRMAGGLGKGGMDRIVLRAVFTLESGREGVSEWMLK